MQYRRDIGFHFLPDFLSVFAFSVISAPLTDYTEFFSVGPRARCWESVLNCSSAAPIPVL